MSSLLSEIKISDLYVNTTNDESTYKATSDSSDIIPIPTKFYEELDAIRNGLMSDSSNATRIATSEFRVKFNFTWKGVPLRAERLNTIGGPVFVCRNWGTEGLKKLDQYGFSTKLIPHLLSPKIRNGLFLFMGPTGSGKSTAAAACLVQRLEEIGGAAWTLECPVERPLNGRHGKGYCYQIEVESDNYFGEGIKQIVRASPNILLIGEIRTAEAANEAVLAAAGGMLVITTYHASDLLIGLARFAKQCGEKDIFASVLCGALFLNLKTGSEVRKMLPGQERLPGRQIIPDRVLQVDPLMLTGSPEKVDPIRSIIRSDNIGTLSSVILAQKESFIMQKDNVIL